MIGRPSSSVRTERPGAVTAGAIWRTPAAPAACLIAGVYAGSFNGLGAVFATRIGWDRATASLFMGAVFLAPVLAQLPLGAAADRLGRRWLMLWVTGGAATIGFVLATIGSTSLSVIVGSAMLFGGLCYPLYALGVGLLTESLPPGGILAAASLANIAYDLGAMSGPLVAGTAMATLGPQGLYLFLACAVLAVPAVLWATEQRECLRPKCCTGGGRSRLALNTPWALRRGSRPDGAPDAARSVVDAQDDLPALRNFRLRVLVAPGVRGTV